MTKSPRILFFDIETSHMIAATFSLFKPIIPHENILQHSFMLCAAWKWQGAKKIHSVSLLDDPVRFKEDYTDDEYVVGTLYDTISEADAVVAHNLSGFDMRKFNTRCIHYGFGPVPEVVQIDTLSIARKHFRFDSNRLDALGEYFGVGRKIKTDNELWLKCLYGDKKSLAKMVKYNKQDVQLLEDVYNILAPYTPAKLNQNLFSSNPVCPSCGSGNVYVASGLKHTRTRVYKQYQCQDCGHYHSSTVSEKDRVAKVK